MHDTSAWESPRSLKTFLSDQLRLQRLALVLGAGVSMGFGLPSWDRLVELLYGEVDAPRPPLIKPAVACDLLLRDHLGGDDERLAELVHHVLYKEFSGDVNLLRKNELLSAIGALVMSSRRGSVARVVTFNYDDVLESYLAFFGYSVESIFELPCWPPRADISIYHPHGFLPQESSRRRSKKIVLTQTQYDRVVGEYKEAWSRLLLSTFESFTCIFIGLSGDDLNLLKNLSEASKTHVSRTQNDLYWGIRFGIGGDPLAAQWELHGVFPVELKDYNEIPGWLFELCQLAEKK